MLFKNKMIGGGPSLFTANISSNQLQLNLATWATSQGWDGVSPAEITINSNVYVYSNNINTPALTTGNFPNGLTLVVYGYIIGKGGKGGKSTDNINTCVSGENGGTALSLGCNTIIVGYNGYIAGGGGGGSYIFDGPYVAAGGGGAGGGDGGQTEMTSGDPPTTYIGIGGSGGGPGSSGTAGLLASSVSPAAPGQGGGAGGGGVGGTK
jgi:hypothetical protein